MEEQVRLGAWLLSVDREATREAYRRATGSDCDCSGCRNFRSVRAAGLPAALLAIFDQLAIDPAKESEVYDLGPVEDSLDGLIAYGGWYHIVGRIEDDPGHALALDQNWKLWFSEKIALPEPAFRWLPLIQVEIDARIPLDAR